MEKEILHFSRLEFLEIFHQHFEIEDLKLFTNCFLYNLNCADFGE